ncbi:hypothetical protein [Anatilimnocola aggregata]|uniref:hypothetical protein n=1 Tax=Anatilimnocola aggregata TaxID=2528021 RepID=UPI0011A83657|nr:hypothetical protein [Anatilimnocola aggregata]
MLVGQQVTYSRKFEPTSYEQATWSTIQQSLRRRALQAMPQEKSLAIIRSPGWTWKPNFYQNAANW